MNPLVSQTLSTAQTIIEMAATAAFALSGIIVGIIPIESSR